MPHYCLEKNWERDGVGTQLNVPRTGMFIILDSLQKTVYPVLDQCYNLGGSVMNERGFLA